MRASCSVQTKPLLIPNDFRAYENTCRAKCYAIINKLTAPNIFIGYRRLLYFCLLLISHVFFIYIIVTKLPILTNNIKY